MNIEAIKKRVESYAIGNRGCEMDKAIWTDASELLRWVEAMAQVIEEYRVVCDGLCDDGPAEAGWKSDEKIAAELRIDELLAELTDAGEG